MTDRRYPLTWPEGWARTPAHRRQDSDYKVAEAKARDELLHSLRLLGARNVVLSTNIKLRNDGLPYANQPNITDPGVAVYWTRKGQDEVIACDAWKTIRENYRAIGMAVEALRQLERCGATEILNRAFTGFSALPAPKVKTWRAILGFDAADVVTWADLQARFRELAKKHHPDTGGNAEKFRELVDAFEAARKELPNDPRLP